MNKNKKLHKLILDFDKKDKKVVAFCHATSTLAFVNKNGKSLFEDKKITGFPTIEEKFILRFKMIHSNFIPIPNAIRNGNIVTGVGPKAGKNSVKKTVREYGLINFTKNLTSHLPLLLYMMKKQYN